MTHADTTRTGAEYVVDALERYGVTHLFGNPGTTELPIMDALSDSEIQYVLGLHEDIAVGAAAGYASTRRYQAHHDDAILPLGVANLHVTPGLAHGLGNLYAASVSGSPLLVTAGNHSIDFQHEEPPLSGDLVAMAEQFTKWSAEVRAPGALPTMLRRAVRTALTPPTGPVFLSLPLDVTMADIGAAVEPLGPIPSAGRGDPRQLEQAATLLVEAEEPVFVLGDGVARAGAVKEAVALAERTGARVHAEILASEVNFPFDHPQWVSQIPPRAGIARSLLDVDTVLFAGCSTNTTVTRHEGRVVPADVSAIHLGADPWELAKNVPATVAVLGDPAAMLSDLASWVDERLTEDVRERRLETVSELKAAVEAKLGGDDGADGERLASKGKLVETLARVAPEAFVVDEAVTTKEALLTRWPLQPEAYFANKGGGLGFGLPAAVGAAMAEGQRDSGRDVVCVVGDGSFLYYPQSLYTAARYDVDLTVVIPDNRNYRILKDNTVRIMGGEYDDYEFTGMDFDPAVDLPMNAASQGADNRLVEATDEIEPAVRHALATDGPSIVDVFVHD